MTNGKKILATILFSAAIASGCGGGSPTTLDSKIVDESTEKETTSTEATTAEELPFTESPEELTDADLVVEADPSGPPVTITGRARANTAIYTGVIGTLDLDQLITQPVADQPQTFDDRHPLTGLAGEVKQRPAAIVKIDNGPGASPQGSLELADIVFEEPVEGGITRLAAVFQSQAGVVGPVRSGRTTDISIMHSFGSPLYLYSGANAVTDSLLRKFSIIQNRSADTSSGYYRESSRRAPSNLYTDLGRHFASAEGGSPVAQFDYRGANEEATGSAVESFTVSYRANTVNWKWDGDNYLRTQRGASHNDTSGNQLGFENVVIVGTRTVNTGMVDASGSTVPEYQFVGTGPAVVHTGGKKISGIWTKPTLNDAATLTTSSGEAIKLTAGQTWVQIVADSSSALQ